MNKKIKESIISTFVADAYSLGSHWIYDTKQIESLPLDWEELNTPQSNWHKGKKAGDLTHYGDQYYFLLEYMMKEGEFRKFGYYSFWSQKMSNYHGYIDTSTRNSLISIGASSSDLSICARLAPLLINALDKESFLIRVENFVSITHNSTLAKESSQFFAELLWDTLQNQELQQNIRNLQKKYPQFDRWIEQGIASKENDTTATIEHFGLDCGIESGFAGVIHLLSLEKSFKRVMQKNAKAGGDSSARAMVTAMILSAQEELDIPKNWVEKINKIEKIREFLHANI